MTWQIKASEHMIGKIMSLWENLNLLLNFVMALIDSAEIINPIEMFSKLNQFYPSQVVFGHTSRRKGNEMLNFSPWFSSPIATRFLMFSLRFYFLVTSRFLIMYLHEGKIFPFKIYKIKERARFYFMSLSYFCSNQIYSFQVVFGLTVRRWRRKFNLLIDLYSIVRWFRIST